MSAFTPRERVLCALDHQEPDRVPIFLGATGTTSMLAPTLDRLKQHLGIHTPTRVFSRIFQYAQIDEELLVRFGSDARPVFAGATPHSLAQNVSEGEFIDDWGIRWKRGSEELYYHAAEHPLRYATLSDLEKYPWPQIGAPARFTAVAQEARAIHASSQCATVAMVGASVFDTPNLLRGMEPFLMDLGNDPDFAEALISIVADRFDACLREMLLAAQGEIDLMLLADDFGNQNTLMISPRMFRRYFKPHMARFVETIHRYSNAKVMLHSCGNIYSILGDLADIGIDLVNPVQVSTPGLADTARLKREFGQRLCFNGAIDTRQVLPHGTPEEVRSEVRRRIRDLAPGGGYVLSAVHCLQPDVPPENILALFDEAQKAGQYPIS